jgi:excisionase family DNA binding protein
MTEKFLTRRELADGFACSISTIRRWEKAGKLKALRLGAGTTRYREVDVEQFLAAAMEVRERCAKSLLL